MSEVNYTNYTNVSRPFMRGYEPGDTLIKGWSGTLDVDNGSTVNIHQLAEDVFMRHNRDDRPDGQLCPSMSVGDVVVIGETALTVETWGFGSAPSTHGHRHRAHLPAVAGPDMQLSQLAGTPWATTRSDRTTKRVPLRSPDT